MILLIYRLRRAWAALVGRDPCALPETIKMALADDILALFPKFQAAVAEKDSQIAALNAQVADLTQQLAAAEAAVQTVVNEISPSQTTLELTAAQEAPAA